MKLITLTRALAVAAIVTAVPLAAQETTENDLEQSLEQETAEEVDQEPEDKPSPLIIDLTFSAREGPPDENCERQADVARITGEIIVCRNLDEASDGYWNAARFERDYAQRTQGPKTPNVDGSGVILPTEGSIFMVTFTTKFGASPDAPLIIDIEALPEPPPGSDADRIASGLNL